MAVETIEQLVSDEAIEQAWGNANFGDASKRDLIANTVLKCACGYATGHTATLIMHELGLADTSWKLTKLGKRYLWVAYSNGLSL